MKSIITALLIGVAAPAFASDIPDSATLSPEAEPADPASAQVDEMMALFSKMFDTSDLPPPEPARLKLAEITAAKLLPDGTYAKIIDEMIGQILTPMFNLLPGLTNAQIELATGASAEAVASLTDEDKTAVTALIDPYHKQRGEQMLGVVKPVIAEAMEIMEPAMRKGLARAYARQFTAAELGTINGFFATPVGAGFARESLAMQADPEVLQATFKALPALFSRFAGNEAKFKARIEELPKQRKLSEMSDTELEQLARLLGMTVQSLKDYDGMAMTDPSMPECAQDGIGSECTDADWAANAAAAAAVEAAAAAAETAALEAETKKQRSAWRTADLKAVERAEASQTQIWSRHEKIDKEMSEAASRLQSAIDLARRNAGQTVEDEHHHDGGDDTAVET